MTLSVASRLDRLDWPDLERQLEARGHARVPGLLEAETCAALRALYDQPDRFRSRVVMARHGYGSGEYQYFGYPLPRPVADLRRAFYGRLAPLARRWSETLGLEAPVPPDLKGFLAHCQAAGQARPTPLLLRYRAGDYNCLHQDSYGAVAFPLQVAICLSEPGRDFAGGEFLLVEQRPRAQSRGEAIGLGLGEAVIFPNRFRPVQGKRGPYRVAVRHGVSSLAWGERLTLGLIFHDAA